MFFKDLTLMLLEMILCLHSIKQPTESNKRFFFKNYKLHEFTCQVSFSNFQ